VAQQNNQQNRLKFRRSESAPALSSLGVASEVSGKPAWTRLGVSLLTTRHSNYKGVQSVSMTLNTLSKGENFNDDTPGLTFSLPPEYRVNTYDNFHDINADDFGSDDILEMQCGTKPSSKTDIYSLVEDGYIIGGEVDFLELPISVSTAAAAGRAVTGAGDVRKSGQVDKTVLAKDNFYRESLKSPKTKRLIRIVQFAAENGMTSELSTILRLTDMGEVPPPPPFIVSSPSSVYIHYDPSLNSRAHISVDVKLPSFHPGATSSHPSVGGQQIAHRASRWQWP